MVSMVLKVRNAVGSDDFEDQDLRKLSSLFWSTNDIQWIGMII